MSSSKRKKERRRARYERNVAKQKLQQERDWLAGKLIEENYSNDNYSQKYTHALAERLVELLRRGTAGAEGSNERFVKWYQMYRIKIRDLMILWNDDEPKLPEVYHLLKTSLEFYWDTRDTLLPDLLSLILSYYPPYVKPVKVEEND